MRTYQKIIAGGLVLAGLAGLVGCKYYSKSPISQPQVSSIRYHESVSAEPGSSYIISIASGDINGDGYPDLIVGLSSGIKSYLNDGSGNYNNPQLIVEPYTGPAAFAVLDIILSDTDKDGDLDLIVSDRGGVATLKNDGKGNFSQ